MHREQRDSQLEERWVSINEKIRSATPLLRKQGGICIRRVNGRSISVIRYRDGEQRHRSIYLGDDATIVCRARQLLEAIRFQASWTTLVNRYSQLAAELTSNLVTSPSTKRVQS